MDERKEGIDFLEAGTQSKPKGEKMYRKYDK